VKIVQSHAIRCGRCGARVARVEAHEDPFMRRVRYTAVCHGEREHVDVDFDVDFEAIEHGGIVALNGIAFASPRLLAP